MKELIPAENGLTPRPDELTETSECGKRMALEIVGGPDEGEYLIICPGPSHCVMKLFHKIGEMLPECKALNIDVSAVYTPKPRCLLGEPE